MELTACLTLLMSVRPDASQFFQYDSITLSCAAEGRCGAWVFKRNTSSRPDEASSSGWGVSNVSRCTIQDAYPSDTGVYWCEAESGERSNAVDITVSGGAVILRSPALPVSEGDNVTLLCAYSDDGDAGKATSDFPARFYKDGVLVAARRAGTPNALNIPSASPSDGGFYMCEHPAGGESPRSRLAVRGVAHHFPSTSSPVSLPPSASSAPGAEPPPLTQHPWLESVVMVIILYTVKLTVCVTVHIQWYKARSSKQRR